MKRTAYITSLSSVILLIVGLLSYSNYNFKKLQQKIDFLHKQNQYIYVKLSGDIKSIPDAKGTLRQKQIQLFEALVDFDKIMQKEGILYWIDYGTLLGAIRHQKFIPWDDDVDVSMDEKNLQKLNSIKDKYNINLSDTSLNMVVYTRNGVSFDIFPQNCITKDKLESQKLYIALTKFFLPRKYSYKLILKRWAKISKDMEHCRQDDFLSFRSSKINGVDTIEKTRKYLSDVYPLKKLEFEGYKFPVPNNYSKIIGNHYSKQAEHRLPNDFGHSHHLNIFE